VLYVYEYILEDTMAPRIGVATFGDNTTTLSGEPVHPAQTLRHVMEQGVLADQVGLDAFGVGEHHRPDYAVSAPDTLLAGLATATERIKLETAVTVLSSEEPVRLYQRFATIHALSAGRAQLVAGRGSFVESFPLFGYPLSSYEVLYEEKLELMHRLLQAGLSGAPVTWEGTVRAALQGQRVEPPLETLLPLRVAVGGTAKSVVRAAVYGLPVTFAIIGGAPARFRSFADLYRHTLAEEHDGITPDVGIHSMGHVAATDEQAAQEFWPHYKTFHDALGRERGWSPLTDAAYRQEVEYGSLYVGSPTTVARKIREALLDVDAQEFSLKYATGTMPHEKLMESIRLMGEEVAPLVRAV
jgi:probable LLM family oxidoreductase